VAGLPHVVVLLALVACGRPTGDGPPRSDVQDSDDTGSGDSATDDTSAPSDSAETGDSGEAPADADGDGAYTPTDCDDGDPGVYPGAYDWCDGVDQDCDGSAQGEGACGEVGDWSALDVGWWEGTEPHMRFGAYQPVVLDGQTGLIGALNGIHNAAVDTDWNAVVVLMGMPAETDWTSAAVGVWAAEEYADHLAGGRRAGDFDGDGYEDIWMVSTGQSGCCDGSAFLVLGPSDRWPKDGAYIRDVADGWWLQAVEDDNFGGDWATGGDIDGDGLADGVFLAWRDIWDGTGGSLHVVRGRTDAPQYGASIAEEITLWKSDGRVDDASWVRIGPDMDGDGAREVVFDAPDHGLGFVAGGDVVSADGGILADWTTVLLQEEAGFGPEFPGPDAVPGDLDGDGLDELILVYQGLPNAEGSRDGDESCYYYLSGAAAAGTIASGTVATACVDNNATGAEYLGEDVDGDGVRDLVPAWTTDFTDAAGGEHDNDHLSCILPSSRLALGGRVEVRDVSLCYSGGIVGATVDLDGDGLAELLAAPIDAVTTHEQAGRVDVLPGFMIPWEDATKW
jgi:hypothetical protein